MRACIRRSGTILAVVLFALITIASSLAPASAEPGPTVVGIILPEIGPAFAVILDSATSKPGFYHVGALVGASVITTILADRVIIVSGGQQTHLRLATPVSSAPASIVADTSPRRDGAGARRPSASNATAVEPPPGPYSSIVTVPPAASPSTGSSLASGDTESLTGGGSPAGGPGGSSVGTQNGLSCVLASLRDLLISVACSDVSGPHRQRLELYAPDGSLYQRLSGSVAPNTQTLIPVGGTWITEHSLFGDWRVDVYVDRETTPITSRAFTLLP